MNEETTSLPSKASSTDEAQTLRGIIPICAWCKSVRDDNGYWQQVAVNMQDHAHAEFSHGICPNCADAVED